MPVILLSDASSRYLPAYRKFSIVISFARMVPLFPLLPTTEQHHLLSAAANVSSPPPRHRCACVRPPQPRLESSTTPVVYDPWLRRLLLL